jgi:hypothetical protein
VTAPDAGRKYGVLEIPREDEDIKTPKTLLEPQAMFPDEEA